MFCLRMILWENQGILRLNGPHKELRKEAGYQEDTDFELDIYQMDKELQPKKVRNWFIAIDASVRFQTWMLDC